MSSKDRSLDYRDQKKWIKRTPEEKERLIELRRKQGSHVGGDEGFAKWERALEYSGSAYSEARKRYFDQPEDRADLAQHLILQMFEKDAKKATMTKESRKYTSEVSSDRDRMVYYGLTEDLEEILERHDDGTLELEPLEIGHDYWSTWHLKACLITGKLLPKDKVHRTMKFEAILALGEEDHVALPEIVTRQIDAIKNEPYKNALIALREGHVADAGTSGERSQRRALEVLSKILNGVWNGL